jgi:hypothetical protein
MSTYLNAQLIKSNSSDFISKLIPLDFEGRTGQKTKKVFPLLGRNKSKRTIPNRGIEPRPCRFWSSWKRNESDKS